MNKSYSRLVFVVFCCTLYGSCNAPAQNNTTLNQTAPAPETNSIQARSLDEEKLRKVLIQFVSSHENDEDFKNSDLSHESEAKIKNYVLKKILISVKDDSYYWEFGDWLVADVGYMYMMALKDETGNVMFAFEEGKKGSYEIISVGRPFICMYGD